jgi:hypothetical protein
VTRGEARADKENDINKILASPAFRFANSRRPWQVGFDEEERTKVGEGRSGLGMCKEFFISPGEWRQCYRDIFFINKL